MRQGCPVAPRSRSMYPRNHSPSQESALEPQCTILAALVLEARGLSDLTTAVVLPLYEHVLHTRVEAQGHQPHQEPKGESHTNLGRQSSPPGGPNPASAGPQQ